MPENSVHFIDTNIWLYALEVCANLIKKAKMPEPEIRKFIEGVYAKHRVVDLDIRVFLFASELREEYSLSFWDSLIVSAAFLSGAETIYSEDMQDGQVIRDSLQIQNPFK